MVRSIKDRLRNAVQRLRRRGRGRGPPPAGRSLGWRMVGNRGRPRRSSDLAARSSERAAGGHPVRRVHRLARSEVCTRGGSHEDRHETHRLARVAEAIREVASETILFELRDPRVKRGHRHPRRGVRRPAARQGLTSRSWARPRSRSLTMHGLKHAAGFVQSKLAKRLADALHAGRQVRARRGREEEHRDDPAHQRGVGPERPSRRRPGRGRAWGGGGRPVPPTERRKRNHGRIAGTDWGSRVEDANRVRLASRSLIPIPATVLGLANMVTGYVTRSWPTTTNKQRLLTQLFTAFKKGHDAPDPGGRAGAGAVPLRRLPGGRHPRARRPGLQQPARAVLRLERGPRQLVPRGRGGAGRPARRRGPRRAAHQLPAGSLRDDFSFDLEALQKKGLKQAAKQLAATRRPTITRSPGWCSSRWAATPSRSTCRRCATARRLGLIDATRTTWRRRASLEHLVPKAKGRVHRPDQRPRRPACWEDKPHCSACPLANDCPTARSWSGLPASRSEAAAGRSRAEASGKK